MKAYRVNWQTFNVQHNFHSLGGIGGSFEGSWTRNNQEKFFATEEAAKAFVEKKNKAAAELSLDLKAWYHEVELE